MAKTPIRGYTIPAEDGSDDIGEWPTIVAQGFIDVENGQFVAIGSKVASDAYNTWPVGISQMGLSAAQQTSGGWPGSGGGSSVWTMRRSDGNYTFQMFFQADTNNGPTVWTRVGTANGWSPWKVVASPALPSAMASGTVTGTPPTGGGTVAMPVVFPAGRFSGAPNVTVSVQSTLPGQCSCSYGGVTATGCTVYLYRSGDTTTTVSWEAVQGVNG